MLPVYKASTFQKFALEGGSSLPCIVSVEDEYGRLLNDDYVIKIFKQDKSNHTCKEVFAAVLAQHFELKTPKPVLIEVNNALLNVLRKQEKYRTWQVTEGVFFGNQYLKNAKSFIDTPALNAYDIWEITNLFAFDVLILNTDRQLGKPNILTTNNDIYVIDHELSMNISKPFGTYLNQNQWDYFIKDKRGGHLFRQYLWQIGQENKVTFDDFTENLRTLKPKILYNYAEQLAEYDYAPFDIAHIVAYLEEVKQNESKFVELLYKLLNQMDKIFKYTLLKYRPSSVLDEQVNIGILFIFSEDDKVLFSYPEHLARLSALFPGVDLNDVRHYLSAIQLKANKLSNKDLATKTKTDNFIENEFFVADANSFFFSDFKIGVYETEAIEKMITHFTNQYFVNYA